MTSSHQRLDHVHPLCPEQVDAIEDVDLGLSRCLLDEDVNGDERPRPTNARTEEIQTATKVDGEVGYMYYFWLTANNVNNSIY